MYRLTSCAIPLVFLLSTLLFPDQWDEAFRSVADRFDLTPQQMRVLPLCLNLLAAAFGIPLAVALLRKKGEALPKQGKLRVLVLAGVFSMIYLLAASVGWVTRDPEEILKGVKHFLAARL